MLPQQVGRYLIQSEIGRGGMATVYQAYDPRFKRDVAIKILPPQFLHDPSFRARFEREAQIIAAIEHPAIVPVYDYGEEAGQAYLVMRLMSGGTLSQRLEKGPLSLSEVAQIFTRLAPALDEVHRRGIIHRDLKPSNIMFDRYGEAYLTDFGIARMAESTSALTGSSIVGTPAYMSPEQARGDVELDGRSDIYALGAILFELLSGKQPYQSTTPMGVMLKHVSDPVPRLSEVRPDLPAESQGIIDRAMAKDRLQRYASVRDMAQSLEEISHIPPAAGGKSDMAQAGPGAPPTRAPTPVPGIDEISSRSSVVSLSKKGLPGWIWILVGSILVIGLCGVAGLILAGGRFFLSSPIPDATQPPALPTKPALEPNHPETSPSPSGKMVFRDNFSDPGSGWVPGDAASGQADYDADGYRILIDQPNSINWALAGQEFSDVSIAVAADKLGGAEDNFFGIICRYQDENNFYAFLISSDGYYHIGKYQGGEYEVIHDTAQGFSQAIHQGKTRNHLQANCVHSTLTLIVNDEVVAQVEDKNFSSGDIGLIAASLDVPGTNILFDDFIARQP
jgi:serine/threonine protein kinase